MNTPVTKRCQPEEAAAVHSPVSVFASELEKPYAPVYVLEN